MGALVLHAVVVVLLGLVLLFQWMGGQPGHQATAAAWAIGLLFLTGAWLAHVIVSSSLVIWRYKAGKLTWPVVVGIHVLSVLILIGVFYIVASIIALL